MHKFLTKTKASPSIDLSFPCRTSRGGCRRHDQREGLVSQAGRRAVLRKPDVRAPGGPHDGGRPRAANQGRHLAFKNSLMAAANRPTPMSTASSPASAPSASWRRSIARRGPPSLRRPPPIATTAPPSGGRK